jgi:hypothetical protein
MPGCTRSLWFSIVLVLAGCAAHPAAEPVAAAAVAETELLCRGEAQTGTRFKKQRCRSQASIAREVRRTRETLREMDRQGANRVRDERLLPPPGGTPR